MPGGSPQRHQDSSLEGFQQNALKLFHQCVPIPVSEEMGGNRYVCHIYAIVLGAKGLSRMIMGSQLRTSGHEKAQIGAYRCPKVLGKPIV